MNPEEEVYSPNWLIDSPVVGAFTMRQPLEELAAFTPVNSIPIKKPPYPGFEASSSLRNIFWLVTSPVLTSWREVAVPLPSDELE
jgi:hypothetical protein